MGYIFTGPKIPGDTPVCDIVLIDVVNVDVELVISYFSDCCKFLFVGGAVVQIQLLDQTSTSTKFCVQQKYWKTL